MKIWPVILDSQPSYLSLRGRGASLLLFPLGAQTLFEHLCSCVAPFTARQPLVVCEPPASPDYSSWIRSIHPANVVTSADALADAVASFELSDTLLIVDSRCLALRPHDFGALVRQYADEPLVSHHLVAFESGVAGTKERVSFDTSGHVRRILRHYESATWPFIAGVTAMLTPASSGILTDGQLPKSLADLRRKLAASGSPSRDVVLQGGGFDLTAEAGLVAASQHFVRRIVSDVDASSQSTPVLIGSGHSVHNEARIVGPVILHQGATIEANAMVFGPAVIGPGARVSKGAVVAQAIVGPESIVPNGVVAYNRVWCETSASSHRDPEPQSYGERLAQLTAESRNQDDGDLGDPNQGTSSVGLVLKRLLDVTAAAFALFLLSPLLAIVAAAVWLDSRGSVLFGDEREGLGGRVFRCWKFRTMRVGAHAVQDALKVQDKMDGPHFKLDRDPRVTRVGRVLRSLNLDELPQLLNVLAGEMSLVGPRPSPFRENQVCVPWREARLSVRPGITGFWQVCRHDRSSGDFHQWIEYDLMYVQHWSFWLDVKILIATAATLGGKAGHVRASSLVGSDVVGQESSVASSPDKQATARDGLIVGSAQ